MHVLELGLEISPSMTETADKRFFHIWRIHNQLVKFATKQINKLERDRMYVEAKKGYRDASIEAAEGHLPADKKEELLKKKRAPFIKTMKERVSYFRLTKTDLESYAKVMRKSVSNFISSQQGQAEADRVYSAVEAYLYRNGKQIHFKRLADQKTITSKSMNGAVYSDAAHPDTRKNAVTKFPHQLDWMGMICRVRFPKNKKARAYAEESLCHEIKYVTIKRRMFPDGWHYYIQLMLEGDAPKRAALGKGTAGIDPGMSAMAVEGDHVLGLVELAPKCKWYSQEISRLQRLQDKARRALNPENFNEDGTVKKGRHAWITSKAMRKRQRQIACLYRQKTEYTSCLHHQLANEIVSCCDTVYVESMDYPALAKRAKESSRKSEATQIRKGRHKVKTVHKHTRKKRFGSSIHDRSPAGFLTILEKKMASLGGAYITVNARKCRASQLDHTTGEYKKLPLSCRRKTVGGKTVLRDPYSSFLLRHADEEGRVDLAGCQRDFPQFLKKQELLISFSPAQHPCCFGF